MTYFLDLFSGIGGFSLGAYWAGLRFDGHYFSEVDDYAIRVYQQRFPDAVPLGDIRNIRGSALPAGDWIIAGGFPCQDISVAGKGAGLAGERSGLWYEYARIIGELRPRYAIMENVGALAFRGLDSVLGSLAALGYDAEWQDIRASDVGAPHRRERLWICAYPNGERWEPGRYSQRFDADYFSKVGQAEEDSKLGNIRLGGAGSLCEAIPDSFGNGVWHESGRGNGQDGTYTPEPRDDGAERALADASEYGRGQGRTRGLDSGGAGQSEQALYDDTNADREPMGRSTEPRRQRGQWSTEPDVGRVAHGIPARVDRLKCLGNSIVPQIAELIFSQAAFDEWRDK